MFVGPGVLHPARKRCSRRGGRCICTSAPPLEPCRPAAAPAARHNRRGNGHTGGGGGGRLQAALVPVGWRSMGALSPSVRSGWLPPPLLLPASHTRLAHAGALVSPRFCCHPCDCCCTALPHPPAHLPLPQAHAGGIPPAQGHQRRRAQAAVRGHGAAHTAPAAVPGRTHVGTGFRWDCNAQACDFCRGAADGGRVEVGGTTWRHGPPASTAALLHCFTHLDPSCLLPRLPPVTALSLCELLRELADTRGCTILTTIHQPSSKIFELFHGLILLQVGGRWGSCGCAESWGCQGRFGKGQHLNTKTRWAAAWAAAAAVWHCALSAPSTATCSPPKPLPTDRPHRVPGPTHSRHRILCPPRCAAARHMPCPPRRGGRACSVLACLYMLGNRNNQTKLRTARPIPIHAKQSKQPNQAALPVPVPKSPQASPARR